MYIERHEIVQTVGRFLVYEIQPVMVKQMGIAAPYETGLFLGIIVGIVIFRQTDGKSLFPIPLVLPFQGAQVVFKMAQHENAAGFLVGNDVDAVFLGPGKNGQFRRDIHFFIVNGSMTGLGDEIAVVEAPEERMVGQGEIVLVNTEEFPWKDSLFHPIVPIQPCLGGPAEMKGGEHMTVGPVEIFQHFRPVIHFFIRHFFHRRPGNDKAVIFPVLNIIKGEVIFIQVRPVRMGGFPGSDTGKIHIQLQRRIPPAGGEAVLLSVS